MGNRGGARAGAGRPKKVDIVLVRGDIPVEVMADYSSGKDFLLDVVNLRFDRLGVDRIATSDRIKAAIEVMPYTDQQKPKQVDAKVDHSWSKMVREAEARFSGTGQPGDSLAPETAAALAAAVEAVGEVLPDVDGGSTPA
jgi:hypothetical protein